MKLVKESLDEGAYTNVLKHTKTDHGRAFLLKIHRQVSSNSGNFTAYELWEQKPEGKLLDKGDAHRSSGGTNMRFTYMKPKTKADFENEGKFSSYRQFLKKNGLSVEDVDIETEITRFTWE